jgi:hypothetical protein
MTFIRAWKKFLLVAWVWVIYHLIRDVLSDILGIHNRFTQFLHYDLDLDQQPSWLQWTNFSGYRKWITFPIEISILWVIPQVRKSIVFTRRDAVILLIIVATVGFWGVGWLFQNLG